MLGNNNRLSWLGWLGLVQNRPKKNEEKGPKYEILKNLAENWSLEPKLDRNWAIKGATMKNNLKEKNLSQYWGNANRSCQHISFYHFLIVFTTEMTQIMKTTLRARDGFLNSPHSWNKNRILHFTPYYQTLPVPVVVEELCPCHDVVLGDEYQPGAVT